jgi:hypothetical protein
LVNFSLDNYEWAKDYVVNNKTLGPRVSPLLEFGENTTKKVLDASPIKLESVIEAVDTRVDRVVTGTVETTQAVIAAPGNLKNKTLEFTHEKLNLIKIDKDATEADLAVSTIAEDVKVITSERWNMLLDASEGYMAQYLPISEEDKEDIKVEAQKGELKPLAIRSFRQTKVLARRTPEKLFSKVSGRCWFIFFFLFFVFCFNYIYFLCTWNSPICVIFKFFFLCLISLICSFSFFFFVWSTKNKYTYIFT